MPRAQCYDVPDGDTVLYDILNAEGFRLSQVSFKVAEDAQANFDNLPNLNIRDDDMMVCSYPKTGTNWMCEMVTMAMNNCTEITGGSKIPGMIEAVPSAVPDMLPSPRLLNTHLPVKYLPKGIKVKKTKVVLICRNPKDVAVSFYNHTKGVHLYQYDGKFENFLEMFMRGEVDYGSYPEYLLEFQKSIRDHPDWPVHVVYYEDLKENCLEEMKKIVQFLGIEITEDTLQEIVEKCSFEKLKEGKLRVMDERTKQQLGSQMKNGFSMYRKGQIGDWKNWFTVAQNEKFESWWKANTGDLDMFAFRYV